MTRISLRLIAHVCPSYHIYDSVYNDLFLTDVYITADKDIVGNKKKIVLNGNFPIEICCPPSGLVSISADFTAFVCLKIICSGSASRAKSLCTLKRRNVTLITVPI